MLVIRCNTNPIYLLNLSEKAGIVVYCFFTGKGERLAFKLHPLQLSVRQQSISLI